MVRVESDHLLIFCGNRYRERLAALVCKVYLLADFQVLRTREICDLKCEDRVRIRHSVSFLRHQMDLFDLADFHICDSRIKSFDHLACTAYELQRLSTIVGRVKLCTVVKSSSVMGPACLSDIASCHRIHFKFLQYSL